MNHTDRTPVIDLDVAQRLYDTYADDLRRARKEQRELLDGSRTMKAQLDDLEAEITYLRLRERQPSTVVEIGCLDGWSTSWILRALRDNGHGTLFSYDRHDRALLHVDSELSEGRWHFTAGDVRETILPVPNADYLFLDAAHSGSFARWYIGALFPRLRPGTPVSVHDVFHGARPWPFSEGAVLLNWLRRTSRPFFTAASSRAPEVNRSLRAHRERLGLDGHVHTGTDDPMVFFTL